MTVEIETGKVTGQMSHRALRLIEDWRALHQKELMVDWELAEAKQALQQIEPLE